MNLAGLFQNTAERVPENVGLQFEERLYPYSELNRLSNRLANGLRDSGLKPGDACILMLPSCPEFVVAYYALAKLGAVIVPVNFLFKEGELSHIFRDSRARGFIGMEPYLEEAEKAMKGSPHMNIRIASVLHARKGFMRWGDLFGDDAFVPYPSADDDILAVLYTSGTTGLPKGAMLPHHNLSSNARTVADMRTTDPNDVVIGVLPLYHIFGQTSVLNASIYLGQTIHLFRHFDPGETIRVIEEETSTVLFAVPTMYNRLLLETERTGVERSSLRYCVSGGASLPVEVLRRFEERFETRIYEGYGLTECSPVCIENPFGHQTKPGSIGLPIPGFQARIVNDDGKDVQQGQVGELIVHGPGVMKGYMNQPEETAETVVAGWLHTGDMARMDEEGYLYIVDRKKDLIIRGGYNVYPREVEEVLFEHPDIVEAGVYGLPHGDLGEEVAADVVPKAGSDLTEEDIRRFVKERLAPYKYPRIVHLVDDLPKSHTGKVLKKVLRERWKDTVGASQRR